MLLASIPLALGVALGGATAASAATVTSTTTITPAVEGAVSPAVAFPVGATVTLTTTGVGSNAAGPQFTHDANGEPGAFCLVDCPFVGPFASVGIQNGTDAPFVFLGTGPVEITVAGPVSFVFNDNFGGYDNNGGELTVTATYDDGINPEPEPQPEPCLSFGSSCIPLPFSGS